MKHAIGWECHNCGNKYHIELLVYTDEDGDFCSCPFCGSTNNIEEGTKIIERK